MQAAHTPSLSVHRPGQTSKPRQPVGSQPAQPSSCFRRGIRQKILPPRIQAATKRAQWYLIHWPHQALPSADPGLPVKRAIGSADFLHLNRNTKRCDLGAKQSRTAEASVAELSVSDIKSSAHKQSSTSTQHNNPLSLVHHFEAKPMPHSPKHKRTSTG
jgi:hypothetical protein